MAFFRSRDITTDVQGLAAWTEVLKNELGAFKRYYEQRKSQLIYDVWAEWKKMLSDPVYAVRTGHNMPFETTGEYARSIKIDKLEKGVSIYPTVPYAAIVETSHEAGYEYIKAWAKAKSSQHGIPIDPFRVWLKIKKQGTIPWNISEEIGERAGKLADKWAEVIAKSVGGSV